MPAELHLHLPERYETLIGNASKRHLYDVILDLATRRGWTVRILPRRPQTDGSGRAIPDGNLHVVDNGKYQGEGYLNAATAYLAHYWHLDPRGVLAESSMGTMAFDPALVDLAAAETHLQGLRDRYVLPRWSRYTQKRSIDRVPKDCVAVFLQGPLPYRQKHAHMKAEPMLRLVASQSGGRKVVVKAHPLDRDLGLAMVGRLIAEGQDLVITEANVHDVLAAAAVTVSVNSATSIEGLLHGTPSICFGKTDYGPVVETVTRGEEYPAALVRALAREPDYAAFLYWYFHDHCLWLDDPGLEPRILTAFAGVGFPAYRLDPG